MSTACPNRTRDSYPHIGIIRRRRTAMLLTITASLEGTVQAQRTGHSNADIGLLQSGGIVHAVAGHADHVLALLRSSMQ